MCPPISLHITYAIMVPLLTILTILLYATCITKNSIPASHSLKNISPIESPSRLEHVVGYKK
jgi:hypothetical protein